MVVVILLIVFAKKGVFGATLAGVAESIVDAADVDDHLD